MALLDFYLTLQYLIVIWLTVFVNEVNAGIANAVPLLLAFEYPILYYTLPFSKISALLYFHLSQHNSFDFD